MERTEVISKLKEIVGGTIQLPAEVGDEMRLVEDLGADSLDLLDILMAVEDTFQVKIPDSDLPRLRTVGSAVAHHAWKVAESQRYYAKKRAEGKKHNQAIRSLGRHLVRVIWSMARDNRRYEMRKEQETIILKMT